MSHRPTLLSDRYTDVDRLNISDYVRALTEVIADPDTDTPLTIGVFGPWGSGKTSMMRMMQRSLEAGPVAEQFPNARDYAVVWFDAWKYEREDALWRALVLRVLHTVRQLPHVNDAAVQQQFDDLERSLYRVVEREELGKLEIQWGEVAKGAGKGLIHLGLNMLPGIGPLLPKLLEKGQDQLAGADMEQLFDGIRRARQTIHREHIQSLEQFQEEFERLIRTALTWRGRRLVVFIDDLDRCLPEKAIEVLEAIKLFMDVEGCIFVLGVDKDVIVRGIQMKYREHGAEDGQYVIDGANYLEKIIQVPFRIPPLEPAVMGSFVRNMLPESLTDCGDVFAAGMGESPRQVKRTVNTFLLLWKLASRAGLDAVRLAKIVAIQQIAPELYEQLRSMPHLVRDLEAYYRPANHPESTTPAARQIKDEARFEDLAPALKPFARNATIRRILQAHADRETYRFEALPADELNRYFTLTQRTEPPEPEPQVRERRQAAMIRIIEPQIVPVGAGSFGMGTSEGQATALRRIGLPAEALKMEMPRHPVSISAFGIGKYPVTNAEYLPFIEDTRHRQPDHWLTVAQDGKESHPVVNVSWDDAMAYCAWLSRHTGKRYALPTEAQWEYACRAGADTIYPFGDAPAALDAHAWYEANSRRDTHPVGAKQPNSWNVHDMLGNVWEWCADAFQAEVYATRSVRGVANPSIPEGIYRTLRGGSYLNAPQDVRCAARGSDHPFVRVDRVGFRVILLPELEKMENNG